MNSKPSIIGSSSFSLSFSLGLLLVAGSAQAAALTKADTGSDLNDPASWTEAATPTGNDVATWSGSALGAGLTLGIDTNWFGISVSGAASDIDISGSGALTLGVGGLDAALATVNITIGNPVVLGADQTWTIANGYGAIANGVISGDAALTLAGRGSLTLHGANSYTGGTTLIGGSGTTLHLYNSSALGTGKLTMKNTSTTAAPALRLYEGITITNAIEKDAATGRGAIGSYSGNVTLTGPMTLTAGNNAFYFTSSGETGTTLAISNSITGPEYTGAFSLRGTPGNLGIVHGQIALNSPCQIIGDANWLIASGGNTWVTETRMSQGVGGFILGTDNALPVAAKVKWDSDSSGVLELAGHNQTVAGLECPTTTVTGPSVANNSPTSDALLRINGGGYTFIGSLVDSGARKLSVELLSGTQTLAGYSAYSGSTTVSAGTLRINGILGGSGPVLVKQTGTLAGYGTIYGPVTVQNGGSLSPGDAGLGYLTLAGNLTLGAAESDQQTIHFTPGSPVNVSGALERHGTITVNVITSGTVQPGTYPILFYAGPMISSGFVLGQLPPRMNADIHYSAGSIDLVVSSGADSVVWSGGESAYWNGSALNWKLLNLGTATSYYDGNPGDAVVFDDTLLANPAVLLSATVRPASVTFSNAATAYSLSGAGSISGACALVKTGPGALNLYTSNSFTGNVSLTGGSLVITNASALGSGPKILNVKSALGNFAELHLNGSSGPVILPAEFRFDTYGDAAFQGNIVNDAGHNIVNSSLNMNSGGGSPKIAVLGGSLTFNGEIWCTNGSSAKTMQLAGIGTNTINGLIRNGSRASSLAVLGGTWIINNMNTYTGTTLVTNGAMVLNGSTGTGAVTVEKDALLTGGGTLSGATAIRVGGTLAPGTSIGSMTVLNKNLTLAGTAVMEIGRNGAALTNDMVTGIATMAYGGTLIVTNVSVGALQVGDSFQLFAATSYSGAFTEIIYPSDYTFTNTLLQDGRIYVATGPSTGTPPEFTENGVARMSDGNVSLTAVGEAGSTYTLWTTTNLTLAPVSTTWTPLTSGTVTVSPFTINDYEATNFPARFYMFSAP